MRTPYLCPRADPQTLSPPAAPFTRSFGLQALSPCAYKLLLLGPSRFSSLALQGFSFLAPCAFTFLLPCSSCFCYSAYLPALRLLVRICFCRPTSQLTQQSSLAACINLLEACFRRSRSRSLWFSRALFHRLQLASTCSKLASVAPVPGLFGSGLRSPTPRSLFPPTAHPPLAACFHCLQLALFSLLPPPLLQVSMVQLSDLPRLAACFRRLLSRSLCFHPKLSVAPLP